MKKYNIQEILNNKNFRKHIKRILFPNVDLNAAWVDEDPNFISSNEDLSPILEMNMDIVLIGEGFLIERKNNDFYYYDDEFQSTIMENPYDWINVPATNTKYSSRALQFFVDYYLSKKHMITENITFVPFERNNSNYLVVKENDVDILNTISDILSQNIHGEKNIINKIELETNCKVLFIVASYAQYEDLMKAIEFKNLFIFKEKLDKTLELTENYFRKYKNEYCKFIEENKLEDY